MYLLDTNVVSALQPGQRETPIAEWLQANTGVLFLSVVTIAEVEAGLAKLRRNTAGRRAEAIATWIEATVVLFADRILAFDIAVARTAGAIHDGARAAGVEPGFADVAIAATAKHHKLKLLTRNTRHFSALGVPLHDPFKTLPSTEGRRR